MKHCGRLLRRLLINRSTTTDPDTELVPLRNHPQSPPFSGQVKVFNLTPEGRSPYWMGSGDGRGRIVRLGTQSVELDPTVKSVKVPYLLYLKESVIRIGVKINLICI
jgi:hypothetical protein